MRGDRAGFRSWPTLLWIVLLVVYGACSIGPLAFLVNQAIGHDQPLHILVPGQTWRLLGRTIAFSASVTILATAIGIFVGCRLGTTTWPGKRIARAVLLFPLILPPYLYALGWTTFFRPSGSIANWLTTGLHVPTDLITNTLYSFGGASVMLALAYCPIAILLVEKSLTWSYPSLAETARIFGANRRQTFQVAHWPFVRIGAGLAAMLIFILAASDLGVPTILKVPVFNFEVFTQLSAFNDVTTATLLTLPLIVVGLLLVAIGRRFTTENEIQGEVQDISPPPSATRARTLANILLTFALILPVFMIPVGTLVANGLNRTALARMARIAMEPSVNTIRYAATTAGIVTTACLALVLVLRKAPPWRQRFTELLLAVGFATPGAILALGVLAAFDRPAFSGWLTPTSLVIMTLAVRFSVVAYFVIRVVLNQIPSELLEAARLDGAGTLQVVRTVIVPMAGAGIFGAFAVTFILAGGEIGSTILLHPPGGETLLIALYSIEANSPRSYTAAMAIFQMLLAGFPFLITAGVFIVFSGNRNRIRAK